jgi:flavin reductase (DIM6/NTAB) family NADH-FMN oxidoreductase RutF
MDKHVTKPTHHETPDHFVQAMAAAAFGVSIITTAGSAGRFGLTVSAITSVSAQPPLLLACINRKNVAVQMITMNRRFVVNLLSDAQSDLAKIFAGRPEQDAAAYDFEAANWHDTSDGLPVLENATANFICDLETFYDAGTHRIFIGRVTEAKHSGSSALIYCHRKFGKFLALD